MIARHSAAWPSCACAAPPTARRHASFEISVEMMTSIGAARFRPPGPDLRRRGIGGIRLRLMLLQHLARRAEAEIGEQARQLGRLLLEAGVMAEPVPLRHRHAGLTGIELPRMEIEHHGLAVAGGHMADAAADQPLGGRPEKAAAPARA